MSSGFGDDVALQSCSGGGDSPWRSVRRLRGGVASSVVVFDRSGDVEGGVGCRRGDGGGGDEKEV